ncbi:MAG: hypothetical protein V4616_03770 [Bacteroidota bacterium]
MKTITLFLTAVIASLLFSQCSKDGSAETFSGTGLSGSTARFAIVANTLYTVDNSSLNVFSITNGEKPENIGHYELGLNIETISSYGNNLYIGSQNSVYFVDVQNPKAPRLMGIVNHFTSCDPVVSDGTYAYSTIRSGNGCNWGGNQLDVIDVSFPMNPYVLKSYPMNNPKGLAVSGKWLFVCDEGIKMFDKTDPQNLKIVDTKAGVPANDMIADGNTLIVVADDGIYTYDISGGKLQLKGKILKSL